MLRVVATDDGDNIVAELKIEKIEEVRTLSEQPGEAKRALYRVECAVLEPTQVVLSSRTFLHSRYIWNYLGFIEAAILALDDETKEFKNAPISPSGMARRFRGTMPEIQAGQSLLRDNGSAFRG